MPDLVKDDQFLKMSDEIVKESLSIVDEVIQEIVEPLTIVANPEKLIGKPYELWTPQDLQWLTQVYGADSEILNKFIAKKEVEKMYVLEEQARKVA